MIIFWDNLGVRNEWRKMMIAEDYRIKDAIKKNLTEHFFNELKVLCQSKQNAVISCFGQQGWGKSYSLMFISEFLSKQLNYELTIDNVYFSKLDMLLALEKARDGDIYILDEQTKTFGVGSGAEKEWLDNIEKIVRQKKLFLLFSSPVEEPHIYHYKLRVWAMGSEKEWDNTKKFEEQWKYTQSLLYGTGEILLGYIITGTPKNKEFLNLYEEKKAKFIKEMLERRGSKKTEYLMNLANQLLQKKGFFVKYALCNTKTTKKILCRMEIGQGFLTSEEEKMLVDFIDYVINISDLKYKLKEIKKGVGTENKNE